MTTTAACDQAMRRRLPAQGSIIGRDIFLEAPSNRLTAAAFRARHDDWGGDEA